MLRQPACHDRLEGAYHALEIAFSGLTTAQPVASHPPEHLVDQDLLPQEVVIWHTQCLNCRTTKREQGQT